MTLRSKLKRFIPPGLRASLLNLIDPLEARYYRHKNARGARYIDRTTHVLGWRSVEIGKNCVISEGTWINVNHRRTNTIQIRIRDNSFIGRRNFFSSGRMIDIGDYCLTGIDCKFMGSNHVFTDPFRPYISTGTTDDVAINIGVNCWLGANVSIIGNVRIGHGSIIGANSQVNRDIPPFSIVVGSPARVIRRFDFREMNWKAIDLYDSESDNFIPTEEQYLIGLNSRECVIPMPIHAAGAALGDLP